VPALTGVVDRQFASTVVATIKVAAKLGCATGQDMPDGFTLMRSYPMFPVVFLPAGPKHVCHPQVGRHV
jgi:hypothetical protein